VLLGGGGAWAAWSTAGTGAGATKAGSLVTPVLTATRSSTSPTTAIDVSWTASGQLPGATYSVKRDGTTISCTSSPCTDSGLASGTSYSYVVTAKLGTNWSAASNSASASTQAAAVNATSYLVSVPSPATAGTTAQVTITAKRPDNSTDTSYTGTKTVTLTGASTASSPANTPATLPTSATFTNGVAVVDATFVTAGGGLGLIATTGSLTGSTTLTVNASGASKLALTNMTFSATTSFTNCYVGCTAVLGNNGSVTTKVSLVDAYGNLVAAGSPITVSLAKSAGTLTPGTVTIASGSSTSSASATLSDGTGNYSDTLTASASPYTSIAVTIKHH
jgi:hypothetical protein